MSEAPYGDRNQLFVRQKREVVEILVDWETKNQYEVLDEHQHAIGTIVEKAGGVGDAIRRLILRSHRGFEIHAFDEHGEERLSLTRSFFFFFSDLDVIGRGGRKLGSVHRRFGILYKKYDLRDATGEIFARVRSPLWRLWTFPVLSARGTGDAVITKKWRGALSEVFMDADTFMVDYQMAPWTPDERAVIFAAAISVDFDFFENNQGTDGVLGLFD